MIGAKAKQNIKYIAFDYLAAATTWVLFYLYRKIVIEPVKFGYQIDVVLDSKFYIALCTIPIFWILLHFLSGYYRAPYRKSRLQELIVTVVTTFFGVLVLFFALVLDDWIGSYKQYYQLFAVLFALQFVLTYIPRLVITSITNRRVHNRKLQFNTIMVGSSDTALKLYNDIEAQNISMGLKFIGFLYVDKQDNYDIEKYMSNYGCVDNVREIIAKNNIEEVVIALDPSERGKIQDIINRLYGLDVFVKVIPDMYDVLVGKVRINTIIGMPLIEINQNIMPVWQQFVKRFFDIVISVLAMIILSPLYATLAILVKLTSTGPVFYSHYRAGKNRKPFKIYKFRSMYINAEANGPALSTKNDPRITKIGMIMRKTRMDEIPQFYNVLRGDMSLVGPRPEREFYIEQIIQKAPHYLHLLTVRPGITSWGQVKYGYAENVDQMVERLKYDILYIENRSLLMDLKILIYTVKIVLQRKGL